MEGNLFKWTNYWKGWQLRWFVLKDGILSYYNSQNESKNGDCKGSFKIYMFDIIVNKNDSTRMDLILPNEQNLYLKASDYKERQKWLVALASQKATHPSSTFHASATLPVDPIDSIIKSTSSSSSSSFLANTEAKLQQNLSGTYDSTYFLKIKQSELRLYCDLLTQQTHDFKNLILTMNKSMGNENSTTTTTTTTTIDVKKESEPSTVTATNESSIDHNNESTEQSSSSLTKSTSLNVNKLNTDNLSIRSSSFKSLNNLNDDQQVTLTNDNISGASNFQSISNENELDLDSLNNSQQKSTYNNGIKLSTELSSSTSSDNIKKMDEMSSNINITCDMLIQIIRNLIVLSNTSSNVSTEAVKNLLNETESNSSQSHIDISANLDQYKYHLYHPLYLNQHLNQYNTKNIPILPSSASSSLSASYKSQSNQQQQPLFKSQNAKLELDESRRRSLSSSPSKLSTKSLPLILTFENQHQHHFQPIKNQAQQQQNQKEPYENKNHNVTQSHTTPNTNYDNNINFNNLINYNKSIRSNLLFTNRKDLKLPNIHKISFNNYVNVNCNNINSIISNKTFIRNYHIETLKETALLANVETVAEQLSNHNSSVDLNNNNNNNNNNSSLNSQKAEMNMIDSSSSETLVVTTTSGAFPSLTIVAESHKSMIDNKSFFTVINHRFNDMILMENNEIPTEYFLNCCSDMFSLLDSFGSTAFLPVKIDVYGNINKIKQKYNTDTQKFRSLQTIVQHEIDSKLTNARNSATDALMWLTRAIWFLREFLFEFSKTKDSDMSNCVYVSYQNTLKQYHNFVVRSIFSLAMRSLPTKEEFFKRLVVDHNDYLNHKNQFETKVIQEMKLTITGIDLVLNLIRDFYHKNKLET